jgi:hypothetical protein
MNAEKRDAIRLGELVLMAIRGSDEDTVVAPFADDGFMLFVDGLGVVFDLTFPEVML